MRFKDVCGGKLRVYENGAVFRLIGESECTPTISNTAGYASVSLSGVNHLVHRLVAEAFIPNPGNKPQVNHKDGNRRNNCVSNLEWVTAKENVDHAFSIGLIPRRSLKSYLEKTSHGQGSITQRIMWLCAERGVSIHALEKEIGMGNGIIAQWNYRVPRVSSLQKVAEYFGVNLDYLLSGDESKIRHRVEVGYAETWARSLIVETYCAGFRIKDVAAEAKLHPKYVSQVLHGKAVSPNVETKLKDALARLKAAAKQNDRREEPEDGGTDA